MTDFTEPPRPHVLRSFEVTVDIERQPLPPIGWPDHWGEPKPYASFWEAVRPPRGFWRSLRGS